MKHAGHTIPFAAVAVCAMALCFSAHEASAQATTQGFEELLSAAKKEPGKLLVRAARPRAAANQKELVEKFNKRFGLNVAIQWKIGSSVPEIPRFLTELKAGRAVPDIEVWNADQVAFVNKQVPGTHPQFDWTETFAKVLPGIQKYIDSIPVPEVRGTGPEFSNLLYSIAYNTKLVPKMEAPATIEEMGDPKWKDKIGLQSISATPFDIFALPKAWGIDKTERVLRSIVGNKPLFKRGTPALIRSMALGEVFAGVGTIATTDRIRRDGKPVNFKAIPLIPMIRNVWSVPVGPDQKNVNTARLFVAWAAVEGKEILWREGEGRIVDKDWPLLQTLLADNPDIRFTEGRSVQEFNLADEYNNRLYKEFYPGGR
jgi:iron(III) transport system substrate-binding protein